MPLTRARLGRGLPTVLFSSPPGDVPIPLRMKARGLGSLIALAVTGVLAVMGMRSCRGTDASSPANPATVAGNAVAGTCANRQAVADAGDPTDTLPAVTLPPDLEGRLGTLDPGLAATMRQAADCPPPRP